MSFPALFVNAVSKMTSDYNFVDFITPTKILGLQNFIGIFQIFLDFWSSSFEQNIKQPLSLKKCFFSCCCSNFIYEDSEFLILPRAGLRIWASTQAKWWTSREGPSEIPQQPEDFVQQHILTNRKNEYIFSFPHLFTLSAIPSMHGLKRRDQ